MALCIYTAKEEGKRIESEQRRETEQQQGPAAATKVSVVKRL